jgi:hypothetical protein
MKTPMHHLAESLGWFTSSTAIASVGDVTGHLVPFLAAGGTFCFGVAALVRALTEFYREWRKRDARSV